MHLYFAKLGNYQLFRIIMYRKYFSISHLCLFSRQLFQQGEKGIHIYTGFQILRKMYVMLILHMVEIYAT
jgi:hypothetical protein